MKYSLYGHPVSPFSYLIHSALVYKEADFEFHYVNLQEGEQKNPEYLKINPYGVVPTLVRTDIQPELNIYESWAIFEYLEEAFPNKLLLPKDEPLRSRVRAVTHSIISETIPSARPLFLEKLGRKQLTDEERESAKHLLISKLEIIESEFQIIKDVIAFSAFDAIFFQTWNNLSFALPSIKDNFPTLNQRHQELGKNSIIQKVESTPAVAKVREYFKSMLAAAK
ncbi:MAG: glutathione S-transferase family protein [Candidatus Caenarcaniphilales bacterium]|nr:glutathione S-transferase family protein [Candidatus Caenarcaniphilales bacterium]